MFARFYKQAYCLDGNLLMKLSELLTGSNMGRSNSSNLYNSSTAIHSTAHSDLPALQSEIERLKDALKSVSDDREVNTT